MFLQDFSLRLFLVDEVSLFMVFITVVVMYVSYLVALSLRQVFLVSVVFLFMYIFCFVVFSVDNLFYLYMFYEASLLPILYIIVK